MDDRFNVDDVVDHVDRFVRSFDFTRPGLDRSLGRDVAREVAGRIAARSASEFRGADPDPWEANARDYRRAKDREYGWDHPNYRTGQMLSLASLLGEPVVEPDLITMVYGLGEAPDRTYSPRDARTPSSRRRDEETRDVDKARWAHEADPDGERPARPFYELDDDIREGVVELVANALRDYIEKGA